MTTTEPTVLAHEPFDFENMPKPIPVQTLETLKRVEALLIELVEVMTPPTIIGTDASGLSILRDLEAAERAAKIAALVPKDAQRKKDRK